MQFGDLALRKCENPSASMTDVIIDPRHIALVTRQPVERFGHDLIRMAAAYMREQLVEAGAIAHCTRYRIVGENARYRPAFTIGALLANPHLILDRAGILQIAAVTGVDRRAHDSRLLW